MVHLGSVNYVAALVAAVSGFVIGGLWYGPLFQKPWMRLAGMTKEKGAEANMAVTFGVAYVLNFVAAVGIAIAMGPDRSALLGAHAGLAAGIFFVATALGVIYLFEQRPLQLFFINACYQIVNFTVMGLILGLWP